MPRNELLPWWDHVDWTNNPALAFAYGFALGCEAGSDAYGLAAAAAAAHARRVIDMLDARRIADRPGLRGGDVINNRKAAA